MRELKQSENKSFVSLITDNFVLHFLRKFSINKNDLAHLYTVNPRLSAAAFIQNSRFFVGHLIKGSAYMKNNIFC